MTAGIASVGTYVPKRRITNDELPVSLNTSDEWIRSHTGIGSRYVASSEETCSYMATEAARSALRNGGIEAQEIDHIIVATITPDYRDFPAVANLVQDNLGLNDIGSFDIKAACTGFPYGIELARGLIATGNSQKVLVIGSEKLSAVINWEDRSTAVLFGDGAGAVVMEPREEGCGLVDSILRSKGSGAKALYMPVGGTATPMDHNTPKEDLYLTMHGRQVYEFAVKVNVDVVTQLMTRNGLVSEDIAYIVPHQANKRIITAAAKRSRTPLEKYYLNMEEYANTSSASIPLALGEMDKKGLLKRGDKILTVGFGAGLTYGGNYLVW